jgi:hypothetical protein
MSGAKRARIIDQQKATRRAHGSYLAGHSTPGAKQGRSLRGSMTWPGTQQGLYSYEYPQGIANEPVSAEQSQQ